MRRLVFAGCIVWIVGCSSSAGPALAPARGTVTLDGQPVAGAVVNFESREHGFSSSASLAADGSFELSCQYGRGLPLGRYRVTIVPATDDPLRPGASKQPVRTTIPKKYLGADTSGLEAEVSPGATPFAFQLRP